jgi:hypothetical protein
MAEPSDSQDPPDPPQAHRTDGDSAADSAADSRFDSIEDDLAEQEAKRRRRTILIIVLVATLTPFAICGLLFAVCTAWMTAR